MGYLLPILSFDMPLGLINSSFVILNQKPITMAINITRRDSSMRKCLIMNKREYEAFLNVYMMSQGVLGCKYLLL